MNNLLIEDQPLMILPQLAITVGLNEAIVLQQIHYWLLKSNHVHDGKPWIYNSYTEWQKTNFPFWSAHTVQRIIASLELKGFLISGNFNKAKFDRTKWYTIDCSKVGRPSYQVGTMDDANMVAPIPETTQRLTTERSPKREEGAIAPSSPKAKPEPGNTNMPKWYSIISRDKRWPEKDIFWIEDLESSFCRMRGVDLDSARAALEFEALRCVGWLESPKGKAKKIIDRVWTTWIGKVMNDATRNGSMGKGAGRHQETPRTPGGLKPLTPFEQALAEYNAEKAAAKASNG